MVTFYRVDETFDQKADARRGPGVRHETIDAPTLCGLVDAIDRLTGTC